MKKFLLLFIAVPIIVFGQEQKYLDVKDITTTDNGLMVMKSDASLVTGKIAEWYESGQLKMEVTIKDGKRIGEFISYYENGNLQMILNNDGEMKSYYDNGQLNEVGRGLSNSTNDKNDLSEVQKALLGMSLKAGEWKYYYENGQLKAIENYLDWEEIDWETFDKNKQLASFEIMNIRSNNGIKTGKWEAYYDNGQVEEVGNYLDGKPKNGEHISYYENGQIKSYVNMLDGNPNGEMKTYDESGAVRIHTYLNGNIISESGYYSNGQLSDFGKFNEWGKKSGEWKMYHENGQLKLSLNYVFGYPNGESKSYYDNGQLEYSVNYKENEYGGSDKTGECKFYYSSGQLEKIGNYLNGGETGEWKTYFENGQLQETGNYLNGGQTGEWKTYHDNGQLNEIGNYQGYYNKTGEWKTYDENGKLIKTENFD